MTEPTVLTSLPPGLILILAGALLTATGVGAGLIASVVGGMAISVIARGGVRAPMLRSLGWTLVLVAVTTAAALARLQLSNMPVVGAGGYLGAMASTWLQMHFA